MATYTSNLNLKKPALDDDALITDINNNMDILDAAANGIQDALAIVATGNTHAAITSGQFVYVRNHSTLTEGLYVASSNIAANATLSSSNLTADSKGGLNTLSEQIGNLIAVEPKETDTVTIEAGTSSGTMYLKNWLKSGYTLLGFIGYTSASGSCTLVESGISADQPYVNYRNNGNTSITGKFGAKLLYRKNQ